MPYLYPNLTTLQQQAISDILTAGLPSVAENLLPNSFLGVLAYVISGMTFGQYGYLDYIAQQSVPFTATDVFLEAWAALKGVTRQTATSATGTATFTGTNGTDIPSGTILTTTTGITFATNSDVVVSSGTATVAFTATIAGSASNIASPTLSLQSPIAGIASVSSGVISGGSDNETDLSLRNRMILSFSAPPNGGAVSDYVEWALASSSDVTRAWAMSSTVPGAVDVYFMEDVARATYNGFPQGTSGGATSETRTTPATGDPLVVANYIYPLRPVTALVFVTIPTAQPINVTIADLLPNTTAIQNAITTAITKQFVQIGNPTGSKVYQSDITTAIETVPGITRYTLSSPSTPTVISVGNLPTLGTISFP